ncbi:MAG: flagellar hook-associated protein FlgL [Limnohabitans sp.]|nr:flagellar hook-associated protein FlgL [Burkholderiales bacterium]MCE2677253.1 flagellar hook-associated protein FlgL [Burkholderiaceae bacterium]
MKVSTSMFFDRASAQLANVQGNLAKTQEQLSTGKQITKPSDEPDKASLVTRLESEIARQKSYQESIKAIEIRRKAEETALNSTSDVMFRMKELSVQAANDTLGAADRKTIALEMTELRNQILSLANSQDSNGNYLFAGSRVSQMPFSPDAKGVIVYKGDQARMVVGVGDNRRMNQNIPGSDAFTNVVRDDGKGGRVGIGFFQAMGDLIEAVKSSNRVAIQRGISEIDTLQQGLSDATAQVGTDLNVVDSQNNVLDEITLRLKTTMSDIQDLDYTEAITKMNKDQLALEAAQSSFAKISKLSLFNYIN